MSLALHEGAMVDWEVNHHDNHHSLFKTNVEEEWSFKLYIDEYGQYLEDSNSLKTTQELHTIIIWDVLENTVISVFAYLTSLGSCEHVSCSLFNLASIGYGSRALCLGSMYSLMKRAKWGLASKGVRYRELRLQCWGHYQHNIPESQLISTGCGASCRRWLEGRGSPIEWRLGAIILVCEHVTTIIMRRDGTSRSRKEGGGRHTCPLQRADRIRERLMHRLGFWTRTRSVIHSISSSSPVVRPSPWLRLSPGLRSSRSLSWSLQEASKLAQPLNGSASELVDFNPLRH